MTATWLDLARGARRAANTLILESQHRSAASRAYYAVYSKVVHTLVMANLPMPSRREGPNHSRIRRLIESSMPNMDQVKRSALSRLVARSYILRLDADYKPSVLFDDKESKEAIAIMKTVFEAF